MNMPTTDLFEAPVIRQASLSSNVSSVLPKKISLTHALMRLFVRPYKTLFVPQVPTTKNQNCAVISMPTNAPTVVANSPTPVSNARETIQPYFVKTLERNFNGLPAIAPSPVNLCNLEYELKQYPDRYIVDDILQSFSKGFSIGYSGPEFSFTAGNLSSANMYPKELFDNILTELQERRVAGPFVRPPLPNFRTSPVGVIPKKESNKFRTITDLSSPQGSSVNDFIADSESSVSFHHFDEAIRIVAKLGKGASLAKLDVKSAFRICPVRHEDWHLLGFTFQNLFFVDLCLPFGLRSSVNRLSRLADLVLWIMQNNYSVIHSTHYLDDYFLAGHAGSDECSQALDKSISLFRRLGIPLAPNKIVGPCKVVVYLGIEIDSEAMELRLPQEKLDPLLHLIRTFEGRKKCTKKELLSLIGKLSFASKVIPSGRTFIRRLIDLSTTVNKLSRRISLNSEAREDLRWWSLFLPSWNGKYKILEPSVTQSVHLNLFTDASGKEGFGIYFDGKWVAGRWPEKFLHNSIQWKELFPIYLACIIWAPLFHRKRLEFHCDNQAVVDIWGSNTTKSKEIMPILRKMFFVSASHNFTVKVSHVRGVNNSIADSLSRFQMSRFRALAPAADKEPTPIPPEIWKI